MTVLPPPTIGLRDDVADPHLLAQIVGASADAIYSEDLTGEITSWNAAAERLYGCPASYALGRSSTTLVPDGTRDELTAVRDSALAGARVERFDTYHVRPDGQQLTVSVTVSPLHASDGTVVGLATSVQDIADRVRLTAEVAAVHDVLQVQYDALARSNRDLEQFAYVASHDLSEPLRVMTGFVQLLERRYADVLDERGARYVFHVVDGAARMRTLIDDLLEYSRFLRADRTLGLVRTADVADAVVRQLGSTGVEVGDLPDVWSDEASVTAVLHNLIGNALKFHRPDEPARVVVSGSRTGACATLVVDDDGIGVPEEHRERVFRMFSRLHVREDYAGTGIGLAIVQQIAERSGGRAWVEPSPLGGSRFSITLAAAP